MLMWTMYRRINCIRAWVIAMSDDDGIRSGPVVRPALDIWSSTTCNKSIGLQWVVVVLGDPQPKVRILEPRAKHRELVTNLNWIVKDWYRRSYIAHYEHLLDYRSSYS